MSAEEYDEVSNSFLSDNAELWEKIGGRRNTKGIEHRFDFTEEEKEEWLESMVTMVVRVSVENAEEFENRHRTSFLVNTEGFEYARYVGFLTSDILAN